MQDRIGEGGGHGCGTQKKQQNSRNGQGLTKKHSNQILLMTFKGKGWRLRIWKLRIPCILQSSGVKTGH